jgi:hypothetical protein
MTTIAEGRTGLGGSMGWLRFEPKGDYDLILRLRALPGRVMEVLRVKLDALTNQTASDIVTQKLSGQVLHRRTGVLATSVHATPTTIDGTTIRGGVEAAAGPAWYGRVHEMGLDRAWEVMSVKKKVLAWAGTDGRMTFARRVMHPPLPPRPFMKPTAAELQEILNARLAERLQDLLKET